MSRTDRYGDSFLFSVILYVIVIIIAMSKIIARTPYTKVRRRTASILKERNLVIWEIVTACSSLMAPPLVSSKTCTFTVTPTSSIVTSASTDSTDIVRIDVVIKVS